MKTYPFRYIFSAAATFILSVAAVGCKSSPGHNVESAGAGEADSVCAPHPRIPYRVHDEVNSVYYWKTTLTADEAERRFLDDHDVRRAYVRFFDVVADNSYNAPETVVPNATLRVRGPLPVEEIIPVVYITTDAMRNMEGCERLWAAKIVERVLNMKSFNRLGDMTELQLDCDWTDQTREAFFKLCSEVDSLMGDNGSVSSTIRLHQLSQSAPPVDYGVLMLYNTGSFKDPDASNSLLDPADVEPYMQYLADYPLHLDIAYPAYEWQLLFRNGKFAGLLRDEIPDGLTEATGDRISRILRDTVVGGRWLREGDVLRREDSPAATLAAVKAMTERELQGRPHSSVIYHLDSSNLSKYTSDEISNIYK